jgi:hypothetical protein
MWELFTGFQPFGGKFSNFVKLTMAVCYENERPDVSMCTGKVRDDEIALMTDCWANDPAHRPSADTLVQRLEELWDVQGTLIVATERHERPDDVISNTTTPEEREGLQAVFRMVDADDSGDIDGEELASMSQMLGLPLTLKEAGELMKDIDV